MPFQKHLCLKPNILIMSCSYQEYTLKEAYRVLIATCLLLAKEDRSFQIIKCKALSIILIELVRCAIVRKRSNLSKMFMNDKIINARTPTGRCHVCSLRTQRTRAGRSGSSTPSAMARRQSTKTGCSTRSGASSSAVRMAARIAIHNI